jgi:hypoxia up-regulated 1
MIFAHGKFLADKQSDSIIKDCTVTIPSYFDLNKRRMIEDAAELAGLTILQMIHENTAAAVMYGLHRKDFNETHTVVFYNMGGSDTEVSIVRYGSITDEKEKQYEHIEILAETHEANLGSTNVDKIILKELAKRFDEMPERKGKESVMKDNRAVNRLIKDSIKAKEILSANQEAVVKVPELLDYVTLFTTLSRVELEANMKDDLARVAKPIEEALKAAGLTVEDIDQVELIGGGVRVPKV